MTASKQTQHNDYHRMVQGLLDAEQEDLELFGVKQVAKLREAKLEVIARANDNSPYTDLARIIDSGNMGWTRKVYAELHEIPQHWLQESGLKRTNIARLLETAYQQLLTVIEDLEKKERDEGIKAFKDAKLQFGALEFATKFNNFYAKQLTAKTQASESKKEAANLPPRATVGLEHMDDKDVVEWWERSHERVLALWEETHSRFGGDYELARQDLIGKGVYGLDHELRETIGVVGGWWPTQEDARLTAEHLGLEIKK